MHWLEKERRATGQCPPTLEEIAEAGDGCGCIVVLVLPLATLISVGVALLGMGVLL